MSCSRYVNVGLFYLRQLFFANFDLKVHTDQGMYQSRFLIAAIVFSHPTPDAADYTELWNSMREKISLVKGKDLGSGEGTFNHIASGYDAGYYGYTYSLVFAADMYATVFKEDPLDPQRGKQYRDKILRPGGSRDEIDSLKVRLLRGVLASASTCDDLPSLVADRISSAENPTRTPSLRSCSVARARERGRDVGRDPGADKRTQDADWNECLAVAPIQLRAKAGRGRWREFETAVKWMKCIM